jgi:hypothetical protein
VQGVERSFWEGQRPHPLGGCGQPPVPLPWQGRGSGLAELGRPPDARTRQSCGPSRGEEGAREVVGKVGERAAIRRGRRKAAPTGRTRGQRGSHRRRPHPLGGHEVAASPPLPASSLRSSWGEGDRRKGDRRDACPTGEGAGGKATPTATAPRGLTPSAATRWPPVPLPWQGRGIGLAGLGRPPDAQDASVVRPLQGGGRRKGGSRQGGSAGGNSARTPKSRPYGSGRRPSERPPRGGLTPG